MHPPLPIIALLLPLLMIYSPLPASSFFTGQWIKPLENEAKLKLLCTNNINHVVMRGMESPLVSPHCHIGCEF